MLIFDRNWPQAIVELRRVFEDRKEALRDEAAFWLAHSLFRMGDASEALRVIDVLEQDHARSRWVMPAQSLRVEIATRVGRPDLLWRAAVTPTPPTPRARRTSPPAALPPGPPDTPRPPQVLTVVDVRIQALSGLLRREPKRAVPVLREIVVDEIETPQARRALFVLGLSPHEDAREAVMHFARTGPDTIRVVAVEQLGRWPSVGVRNVLASVYASGSERVKLEALRSLGEAGGDRELIRIVRVETNGRLRDFAVAQLRVVNTDAARSFLRTVK